MNKIRKAFTFAVLALVAAASLSFFKPVRSWASQEGAYLYHQFFINGPLVVFGATPFTDSNGTVRQGLTISSGTPTVPATVSVRFLGAFTSSPTVTLEGDQYYDTTSHKMFYSTVAVSAAQGALLMNPWTAYQGR